MSRKILTVKTKALLLGFAILSFVSVFFSATPVFAAQQADISTAVKKSQLYSAYTCFKNGGVATPLDSNSWSGVTAFSPDWVEAKASTLNNNGLGVTERSCHYVFSDFFGSLIPRGDAPVSSVTKFLNGVGYNISREGGGRCATLTFQSSQQQANVNGDPYVQVCSPQVSGTSTNAVIESDKLDITYKDALGAQIASAVQFSAGNKKVTLDCKVGAFGKGGCSSHSFTPGTTNFDAFINELFADIANATASNGGELRNGWTLVGTPKFNSSGAVNVTYTLDTSIAATNKAIQTLSGGVYDGRTALRLSENERTAILLNYLQNYYGFSYYLGSKSSACNLTGSDLERAQASTEYHLVNLSTTEQCFITASRNRDQSVPTYSSLFYPDGSTMNYTDIIEQLNKLVSVNVASQSTAKSDCSSRATELRNSANSVLGQESATETQRENANRVISELDAMNNVFWDEGEDGSITCKPMPNLDGGTDTFDPGYVPPSVDIDSNVNPGANDGADGSGGNGLSVCADGAEALGWIICPALRIIGSATDALYSYVESWMTVDASFLADGSSTYNGWSQLRDIANVIFIILTIIVVLSQITGVGISNYGIKKILPKLIIVAVLVNISFLLGQLAVDVSNIVGASIYNLLRGMSPEIVDGGGATVGGIVISFLSTLGTGVIGGGIGIAITMAAITSPGTVLIPLLIAIVGALIGVLFFFIILAVRKAGIIILVVLAPAAIVCYALPNTKPFFDRWKRIFVGFLMVYPLCGALMGGSFFASNLLLNSGENNFLEAMVAMLLQIMPIFLIPSILRASMAAVGNLGARISMMGARLGHGATGALRRSDTLQRTGTAMDNWGATTGNRLLQNANKRLLRVPGIGRVAGAIENSGVGRAINNGRTRQIARNKVAYRNMRMDEVANDFRARTMTEESLQNDLEMQRIKQEEELVGAAADNIIHRKASYNDGTADIALNPNDFAFDDGTGNVQSGNLDKALQHYLDKFDANPTDENALRQAQALIKVMIDKGGDKGRTTVMRRLKKRNFDTNDNPTPTASFGRIASYIDRDSGWMKKLKSEDFGAFSMIADAAAGNQLSSLRKYNIAGSEKVSEDMVHDISDSLYDGFEAEKLLGTFTEGSSQYDSDSTEQLLAFDQTLQRAMNDPRTAQRINASDLKNINKIHKMAYDAQQARWLQNNAGKTAADYIAQVGQYQDMTPGYKIPHGRATMPAGFYRVKSADLLSTTNGIAASGAKAGDWIMVDSAGNFKRHLEADEKDRAQAIHQHNIDIDIQNGS